MYHLYFKQFLVIYMLHLVKLSFIGIITVMLFACGQAHDKLSTDNKQPSTESESVSPTQLAADKINTDTHDKNANKSKRTFKNVEWIDLMPADDLDALLNPPDYLNDIQDGSLEDQISNKLQNENKIASANDDRYQKALMSTRIIPDMDGQDIKIPGFIVPLEFDEEQIVTQFFLVPFFGACLHEPPPPPNQIIFIHYPQGIKIESLYDPIWVTGNLTASLVENDMATAAYTLEVNSIEDYSE